MFLIIKNKKIFFKLVIVKNISGYNLSKVKVHLLDNLYFNIKYVLTQCKWYKPQSVCETCWVE